MVFLIQIDEFRVVWGGFSSLSGSERKSRAENGLPPQSPLAARLSSSPPPFAVENSSVWGTPHPYSGFFQDVAQRHARQRLPVLWCYLGPTISVPQSVIDGQTLSISTHPNVETTRAHNYFTKIILFDAAIIPGGHALRDFSVHHGQTRNLRSCTWNRSQR